MYTHDYSKEYWVLLYLHDWSGKGIWPEIRGIYETMQDAEKDRSTKLSPDKYHTRRAYMMKKEDK